MSVDSTVAPALIESHESMVAMPLSHYIVSY